MAVRFGEFVLDEPTRELRRAGRTLELTPKAFELLRLLVESRPRAVAKRELYERLWPDVVVVEANLANLIGEVRAALGEDARHPRFIRTLHRYGYAFRDEEGDVTAGERRAPVCRLSWKGGGRSLGEGEHVLGRDPALDLFFDSDTVSRRHARIVVAGARVCLEDLGSKNGTFVGGRRLAGSRTLEDGDELRLGSVRLRIRMIDPARTTRTGQARS